MSIKNQVELVKESLKEYPTVKIVAATKAMSVEGIKELYDCGIKEFGENRTDMFLDKYESLKNYKDIKWHFFGTLQTRKIKEVANKISCLHSLDRLGLALELDKRLSSPLDCFVEVNISEEPNKAGIPSNKVKTFIKQLAQFSKINVIGLMCMAKRTADEEILEKQFSKMQKLKDEIEKMNLPYAPCHELSMGMSNDYKIAVKFGATNVRLGSIFLE